jgi:uncharacterized membrane protein YgcG
VNRSANRSAVLLRLFGLLACSLATSFLFVAITAETIGRGLACMLYLPVGAYATWLSLKLSYRSSVSIACIRHGRPVRLFDGPDDDDLPPRSNGGGGSGPGGDGSRGEGNQDPRKDRKPVPV